MSEDKTWIHRAFPTLTPAEAEACIEGLPYNEIDELEWIVTTAEQLPRSSKDEIPAQLEALDTSDLYQRFLFGEEPIPDLATAEYIRYELQRVLALWVRDCTMVQSKVVANVLGQKAKRPDAQRRRYLLWLLCSGDIHQRGVVKELASKLNKSPDFYAKFGFPAGTNNKKLRTTAVRELIKEMRAAAKAGDRVYTLSATEQHELEMLFMFDDLDASN